MKTFKLHLIRHGMTAGSHVPEQHIRLDALRHKIGWLHCMLQNMLPAFFLQPVIIRHPEHPGDIIL